MRYNFYNLYKNHFGMTLFMLVKGASARRVSSSDFSVFAGELKTKTTKDASPFFI